MIRHIRFIGFILIISLLFACSEKGDFHLGLSTRPLTYPILKGKTSNPILRLTVDNQDVEPLVQAAVFQLENKDLVKNVHLYYTGSDSIFHDNIQYGKSLKASSILNFEGQQVLKKGKNYFWLSLELKDQVKIQNSLETSFQFLQLDNKKRLPATIEKAKSRLGIALRKHNDDGVHTYRIPGLATTNQGTLIAVYDIRRDGSWDLQGDIDVGMQRSTDGGQSWEPMEIIMDMKSWGGLPEVENGIGDPSILIDRATNTIWVAAVWAHGHPGKRNWWASKQGVLPAETSQFVLVKSEDDGKSWSEPINITPQIKNKEWYLLLQGPGKGISLKDGSLVFPAQYKDKDEMPHSTIISSKDQGENWTIGTGAKSNTTEAQVIQLNDGRLMLNMRDNRNRTDESSSNGRSVYVTSNLGESWVKHPSSRTNALQESTCMASIIKEEFVVNGELRKLVLFSNPNTMKGRHHMTIKASLDDGMSWLVHHQLLLDEGNGRGYSCMTKVDDEHVGILYEGSQADICFQLIAIKDIIQ